MHEIAGTLELGPPKTPAAVRNILLPPFLVTRLRDHLDSHDHTHVFVGAEGGLYRRSNFSRRYWRPATDGNPRRLIAPVVPGMHFHDLRPRSRPSRDPHRQSRRRRHTRRRSCVRLLGGPGTLRPVSVSVSFVSVRPCPGVRLHGDSLR
ncbi:hypothetical protein Adu01nite_37730 [Paractinoplanes durhamensis]|uniref:Uncharacterized protein n=1 Tax=Paractinoplanes durhamensis TaxID=113563 RepID=A0ABQ3YXV9_9ACTN|nr:hypothetical protein Adu01nite_37730 [Actinoplanes durhamensis]